MGIMSEARRLNQPPSHRMGISLATWIFFLSFFLSFLQMWLFLFDLVFFLTCHFVLLSFYFVILFFCFYLSVTCWHEYHESLTSISWWSTRRLVVGRTLLPAGSKGLSESLLSTQRGILQDLFSNDSLSFGVQITMYSNFDPIRFNFLGRTAPLGIFSSESDVAMNTQFFFFHLYLPARITSP